MDTYTIEAGSETVMGYGNHMFWVLKVNGDPIAEMHGFPVDENKVRVHWPTGILHVAQFSDNPEMASDFGVEGPIDDEKMTGLNDYMSREVYRTNSQEDVLNRWNAGTNEINSINYLNANYYFNSENSNTVHGALGTVMGFPVEDFDPKYTPGLNKVPWLLGEINWETNDYTYFSDGTIMFTADLDGDGLIERVDHYDDGAWHIGSDGEIFLMAEEIVVEGIKPGYYEIQNGDTLSEIAENSGVSVDELVEYNYIENQDEINAGDMIFIPGDSYFDTDFTTGFGDDLSWSPDSSWDDPNGAFYDSLGYADGDLMFGDNGYDVFVFDPRSFGYDVYEMIMENTFGGWVDFMLLNAIYDIDIFQQIADWSFGEYPSFNSEFETEFGIELIGSGSLNEADFAQ